MFYLFDAPYLGISPGNLKFIPTQTTQILTTFTIYPHFKYSAVRISETIFCFLEVRVPILRNTRMPHGLFRSTVSDRLWLLAETWLRTNLCHHVCVMWCKKESVQSWHCQSRGDIWVLWNLYDLISNSTPSSLTSGLQFLWSKFLQVTVQKMDLTVPHTSVLKTFHQLYFQLSDESITASLKRLIGILIFKFRGNMVNLE